jgi:hypothetical protein
MFSASPIFKSVARCRISRSIEFLREIRSDGERIRKMVLVRADRVLLDIADVRAVIQDNCLISPQIIREMNGLLGHIPDRMIRTCEEQLFRSTSTTVAQVVLSIPDFGVKLRLGIIENCVSSSPTLVKVCIMARDPRLPKFDFGVIPETRLIKAVLRAAARWHTWSCLALGS